MNDVSTQLNNIMREVEISIRKQMQSRGYRAANELRNASQIVLRGQRHGRRYIVPGTGRLKYYKRDSDPVGLVYHRRNSKNHQAGTASLIYRNKAGTARISYRYYTASAPGEPPAVRTGAFRMSWQARSYVEGSGDDFAVTSAVESRIRTDNGKYLLGKILEEGTENMEPRPHHDAIKQMALPKIERIYSEPYF